LQHDKGQEPAKKRGLVRFLANFAGKWWFPPFVGLLTAADAYVVFVPNEALILSAVWVHPQRWFVTTTWSVLGSTLGAVSFADFTARYGEKFVRDWLPGIIDSRAWTNSVHFMQGEHGGISLALISLSPFPQHAAVAIAGLAHMPLTVVLFAVLVGRGIKYYALSWAAVHAPEWLRKLRILKH
jgi:membrane protein YqaA with SNARE-associated domain